MRICLVTACFAFAVLGPAPVASAAQLRASEFPARVLAAHNRERVAAGVAPLVWDNSLGSAAAAYAQQMAITGRFEHSNRRARPGTGENLWMGTHGAFSVESMVGGWIGEKRYFRPGIFPRVSNSGDWVDVGHYTQLIWPTSQRIGCALASTRQIDYLVCRYAGAGNIDGRWVGRR